MAKLHGQVSRRDEPPAAGDGGAAHVVGGVRALLRVEGLAVLAVALVLYARSGAAWGLFAALFLVPDVSFLGYLAGPRVGAAAYNAMHGYLGPLALAGAALAGVLPSAALPIALIWCAHIGMDRALGYGLKYAGAFGHTHLGRVGKTAAAATTSATTASATAAVA